MRRPGGWRSLPPSGARGATDDHAAALGMWVVRVIAMSNAAELADGVETVVQSFRDLEGKDRAPDAVVARATSLVNYVVAAAH